MDHVWVPRSPASFWDNVLQLARVCTGTNAPVRHDAPCCATPRRRRATPTHKRSTPRHAAPRRFMDEIRRKHGAAWAPGALAPGGKLYAPSAGHTGVLEGRSRRKRECDYGVFMPRHVCLFSDDAMQARALVLVPAPMDTPACPSQSLVRPTCRTASLMRPLRRGRGRTSS